MKNPGMLPPRPAARFVALDGVRGIAALAVVLYHYSEFGSGTPWLPRAWLAVDVFVCLSGFVIAHNYRRRIEAGMSFAEFLRRRLARLYPVYLFGLVLGMIVFVAAPVAPAAMSAAQFAIAAALGALVLPFPNELVMTQGTGHVVGALFPFDGPAWSMFFELAVNAAFFAFAARRRMRLGPMLAISAALYLGIAYASTGLNAGWSLDTFATGFPRVAFAFFAGVALHRARERDDGARKSRAGTWAVPAVLAMLAVFALPAALPGGPLVSALGALGLGSLVVRTCAVVRPGPRLAALCHRLGWLSYPLYIVHVPLFGGLALLDPAGGWPAPAWAIVGAKTLTALALAWCVAWLDDARRRHRRGVASASAR
jgi:peptidoglycan/LPS O-acetylase OafA/YrhL